MKTFLNKFSLIIILFFQCSLLLSQTIINYQTWTPPSPLACNIFSSSSPEINISGIAHRSAVAQPYYDGTNKSINLDANYTGSGTSAIFLGTEYRMSVNFKKYYSYKITINAA